MTTIERIAGAGVGLVALLALGEACRESRAAEVPQAPTQSSSAQPARADSAAPFVAHLEHIRPGQAPPRGTTMRNPYAGNAQAIATGAKLFVSYNCVDCHGADGSGAMGPSLADGRWHFGGAEGEVFESIYQGRPDGMPAWGSAIAPNQIWMLVAYVQSLSAGKNVSVENFSGKTVERTGH
ncbi:MAG: c-type cytochrome [Gemmatimonadaceae bacterium]|nr:c-type cytochrome [Gemmatimonadaceae bacterium]